MVIKMHDIGSTVAKKKRNKNHRRMIKEEKNKPRNQIMGT